MTKFKDVFEFLAHLIKSGYYGKIELNFQNGKIVKCEKLDSIKFGE